MALGRICFQKVDNTSEKITVKKVTLRWSNYAFLPYRFQRVTDVGDEDCPAYTLLTSPPPFPRRGLNALSEPPLPPPTCTATKNDPVFQTPLPLIIGNNQESHDAGADGLGLVSVLLWNSNTLL